MRAGFTLLELVFVLFLTGMGVSLLVPAARTWADRFAVVGAREATIGLATTTRALALASEGAVLVIDESAGSAWTESNGVVGDSTPLASRFGVSVHLLGSRTRATLRFDALGIGRVASQSVTFRRNRAMAGVVLSSYGAVSRR